MKKILIISLTFLSLTNFASAQETSYPEKFGKTLNLGVGLGYYGYAGRSMPVLHADYEFDVARNFTLAPFINFYSYRRGYYWGNNDHPYRYYNYRETVIPIGAKGTYYFDELFHAGSKWDFYVAGSLGFSIVNSSWDNDYYGDRNVYRNASSLYFSGHIGAEYHMNAKTGLFLDLSSGVSTFGLAVHF
ncbi:MAG: hypothetical protein V4608_09530 [Bacteroidota bacterium]